MPTFRNEGGPTLVVELGRTVEHGETFKGSDALRHAAGLVEVKRAEKAEKAPEPAEGGES